MSKAQKKEPSQASNKNDSKKPAEKYPQEVIDAKSKARKASPYYAAGIRAFNNGESVTILPEDFGNGGNMPIEWLYGFIDAMADTARGG